MTELYDNYGYIVLPKSFKLYHCTNKQFDENLSDKYNHTIFCCIGEMFDENPKYLYKIELLEDYKFLLAIKKFNGSQIICSLPEIANKNDLFRDKLTDSDDLWIKQHQQTRDVTINYLRNEQIEGWLTSLENKSKLKFVYSQKIHQNIKLPE